jgi:hypothetical protein
MRRQAWADSAPMVGSPILPKGMQGQPPRKDRKSAGETARMAMARHHRQRLIEVTPWGWTSVPMTGWPDQGRLVMIVATDRIARNYHAGAFRPDRRAIERGGDQDTRLTFSVVRRSEEYRSRAAECKERAREARDSGIKRQFEEVAQHWLQLAAQMERLGW